MAKKQTRNTTKKSFSKSNVPEMNQQSGISEQSTQKPKTIGEEKTKQNQKQVSLTHDQISERAKSIWQQRGCQVGEDERNWLEAENQLKQELSIG